MIISHFPLLASIVSGVSGSIFSPMFGSSVGASISASAFAPVFTPVSAPVFAAVIGGEEFNLIRQPWAVAQAVLLILLIFSIMSWSVILTKWSSIKRARTQSGRFLRAFRKAQRLQDVAAVADQFRPSPLVGVFEGGFEEFRRQMGNNGTVVSVTAVQRAMQIANSEELTRLERNLPWLAITGAV